MPMLGISARGSPSSDELREASLELVRKFEALHRRLVEAVEEVWGADAAQPKPVPPKPEDEKIAKPKVPRLAQSWGKGLLDVL
jgi:hypothetical protein